MIQMRFPAGDSEIINDGIIVSVGDHYHGYTIFQILDYDSPLDINGYMILQTIVLIKEE